MKQAMRFKMALVMVVVYMLFTVSTAFCEPRDSRADGNCVITKIDKKLQLAVSQAIKNYGKDYYNGEFLTEGHIILAVDEINGQTKAYTIASVGWFGFENGIFTKVSGSGAIPTVMTFSKNNAGEYSLLKYKEPVDGTGNLESTKQMFPKKLWDKVLNNGESYPNLKKQQETQAGNYLKSIGKKAKVSADYVEKELPHLDVQASNKLVELEGKDAFLNNFPYWLGTKERVENGARYIYEKIQSKTGDGCELITYRKIAEDGCLIEQREYRVVGGNVQLVE